jgi:DNA-binding GntR family transcriptional regulator
MAASMSLKDKVREQILQKIVKNEFPIDELIIEGKLAQMFGVSRAPVREALVELCNENILRNLPRAGYQIVQLSQKDIKDAIHVRILLEVEAGRLACQRITDKEIDKLKRLKTKIESQESGRGSLERWITDGAYLHSTLAAFSGNGVLCKMIREIIDILRRAMAQVYLHGDLPSLLQPHYHLEIIQALMARDEIKTADLLCKDINTLREFLQMV